VAIELIGRLTLRNPAYVMPSLRKTLIQLLTELEFSSDSRNKARSVDFSRGCICVRVRAHAGVGVVMRPL
jgi:phosphatidylinositol kinase/protein kinase (PI-3  family)